MASVEQMLQRGEIVHFKVRPHGVIFLRSIVWAIVGVAMFIVAPVGGQLLLWAAAGGLFFGAAIVAAVESGLRRRTTELAVTDRRVILRTGRLGETTSQAFGPAIGSLEINQGALSRRLGYAWFRIPGLGREMPRVPLPHPEALRTRIEALALGLREPAFRETIAVEDVAAPAVAPEPKPVVVAAAEIAPRAMPVRLAVRNDDIEPAARRKPNGDARPTLNGDGRIGLRLQPEIDRI